MLHTMVATPSCTLVHLVVVVCLCTRQPCCEQPLLLQQARSWSCLLVQTSGATSCGAAGAHATMDGTTHQPGNAQPGSAACCAPRHACSHTAALCLLPLGSFNLPVVFKVRRISLPGI